MDRKHPSGRPIRRVEIKGRPIWRVPDIESNVPRLRRREQAPAIGFTVGRVLMKEEKD